MTNVIGKVTSRFHLCKLKSRGSLPQFSWPVVVSMVASPNRTWPTEKLAIPIGGNRTLTQFKTPLGIVCSDLIYRQHLGLLVFEELCAIYENGPVKICKGDIVLDLGAHVGTFTRFALNRGAAMVIAFEPEPSHVACLKSAFASEIEGGSVHIVQAAAWHEEGRATFVSDGVGSKVSDNGRISVSLTTVDKVRGTLALERVDFIKADIEGAERHALVGATETIRRFGPKMAICIYHLPDDPKIIPQIAKAIRPYSISANAANEQAFFSTAT